jgi:hypothetical protein
VIRVLHLLTVFALAAACSGVEPGGGGVNISEETTTTGISIPATSSTTSTTAAPTTTSTNVTVAVNGVVVRASGSPVARAIVTMGDEMVVTGPDGTFVFQTTSPMDMRVEKQGWASVDLVYDPMQKVHTAGLTMEKIRGLRVSADAAGDDAKFASLIHLADESAINGVVFDTKEEGGRVVHESAVQAAHEAGAVDPVYDARARIDQAHASGLYVVTRIVTFEDGIRVSAHPEEKLAGAWLDPAATSGRQYILDLAADACGLGFDEIQFDYVRYPSGRTAAVSGQLDMTQDERVATVAGFLAEARALLNPLGCAVSADIFGIVASTNDDQGLGQRPEDLSAGVDVLSPMVYPSHYSPGWLGFENPNDHPYDVTADAISDALPRMADGSELRPWLQAFWWSSDQIRRSIQAAEDMGVGWSLWNVVSNYDLAAIPTDEEVSR